MRPARSPSGAAPRPPPAAEARRASHRVPARVLAITGEIPSLQVPFKAGYTCSSACGREICVSSGSLMYTCTCLPISHVIMDFEGGIDTSAHSVGRAHNRENFVPSICARPAES